MKWEIRYRDGFKSFWIESVDNRCNKRFIFSTHSLERAWTRSTNIHTMQDFQKPIGRIMRCATHYGIYEWINRYIKDEERFIIHDMDNNMAYTIQNNVKRNHYCVISTFNEFWQEFNAANTKEIWLSVIQDQWWDKV